MDIIFDIDGVLADPTHRLHLIERPGPDWDAFFEACDGDAVHELHATIARNLQSLRGCRVLFCTGRPESVRKKTSDWLAQRAGLNPLPLYMRDDGDHAPAAQIKLRMLPFMKADGYNPRFAIDDDPAVCAMWKDQGLSALLVL